MTKTQITKIPPKDTKDLINALAGYYFMHVVTQNVTSENDDSVIANITMTIENIADMQQFIIMYYLLMRTNNIDCDFDFLIKYQDGYGVNGQWMRQPITTNLSNCKLMDNMINTQDGIGNILQSTLNAFARSKMLSIESKNRTLLNLLSQEQFLYELLPMQDFQNRITAYIDLGWQDDVFKFNDAVNKAVTNWTKHYTLPVIDKYTIIRLPHSDNKARILMPEKDRAYLAEHQPELLNNVLDLILNSHPEAQKNIPLWTKYDYQHHQLAIDTSKYKSV